MPSFVTIRPVGGARVPMPVGYGLPHGAALPQDGMSVARDPFVDRLIRDGDVEIVPDEPAAPAAPAAKAPPAKPAPAGPSIEPGNAA